MLSVDGIPSENGIFQEVSQEVKNLQEDIKTGKFKNAYLLFGEEAYLKIQYKEKLIHALNPDDDTMNFTKYEGKGIEVREMIDLCETMPFFADHRVVLVENSGFFKNKCDELADYMKTLPDYLRLVFVEEEVDKRSRMYKAVKNCGRIVEFAKQDEKTLMRWILGMAKKEKLQMSEAAVRYLLAKTGNDMENLGQELEKLFCYCMNHTEITAADIDEICTTQIGNHIFDMVDAVAAKEQKKALDYYYDLLTLKEPPMRILYLLTRQFRILMEVKEMDRTGVPPKEIAAKVGSMPFLVGKYRAQAKAFTRKELRGIVEAGVQTEEDVKTGKMGDILSVELFLVQYSSKREK